MNSIHAGLYYAALLILSPQPARTVPKARCIVKQGAGLILDQQLARKPLDAETLRTALTTLLASASYREAAAKLQPTLRVTGYYRQAAAEIQAYLAKAP